MAGEGLRGHKDGKSVPVFLPPGILCQDPCSDSAVEEQEQQGQVGH
jgi:hypothetical protein